MLERDVERRFVAACKRKGLVALKLALISMGGFPDRTVIGPNRTLAFVELKRPVGGKLTVLQAKWLKRLSDFGFHTAVISHPDQFEAFFQELL
jgi:hypothetical protein